MVATGDGGEGIDDGSARCSVIAVKTCQTGAPSEYSAIGETMSPVALATISDWIVHHTK